MIQQSSVFQQPIHRSLPHLRRATLQSWLAALQQTSLYPAGPLPAGTVLWSNTGAAADLLVPAVPSQTGVADVFAVRSTSIQAITGDGIIAWTANVSPNPAFGSLCDTKPDFQGGLIVQCDKNTVYKLDGLTGQAYPAYTNSNGLGKGLTIHPDGTIFTNSYLGTDPTYGFGMPVVIGVDSMTGSQKFSFPINYGSAYEVKLLPKSQIIAGDGYGYLPYVTREGCGFNCVPTNRLELVRVDSSGGSSVLSISEWRDGNELLYVEANAITNADTGVLLSIGNNDGYSLAVTSGASVSVTSAQMAPNQSLATVPVLQAQDGSFVGKAYDDQFNEFMVAFDASGNARYSIPNEYPQIALADGGVIGSSGATYDVNGSARSRVNLSTQTWTGNEYDSSGSSTDSVSKLTVR